jgi:UDP-N-acetyl-2-amino-2-deoxyglucuronate dehydrogenase
MSKPLGIGLIGCGRVSPLHLAATAELEGARLVALADLDPTALATAAAGRDVATLGSAEELIAHPDVDLVVIATPSGTHARLGIAAAAAGRHVLVEKPIDVDPTAARVLIAACRHHDVTLGVISQHRFDAGTIALKAILDAGALDPVVIAEGRVWWYRTDEYYGHDTWRGTRAMDGGALMNQGVHTVDLLRWLLGPVRTVSAAATTAAHRIQMEDTLVATLTFERGTLATLAATTAAAPGQPETVSVGGPSATLRLENGRLHGLEQLADRAELAGIIAAHGESLGEETTAARGSPDLPSTAHRAQLQEMVNAIAAGREPLVSGAGGLAALEVVDAAYRSAETGTPVTLSPTPQDQIRP